MRSGVCETQWQTEVEVALSLTDCYWVALSRLVLGTHSQYLAGARFLATRPTSGDICWGSPHSTLVRDSVLRLTERFGCPRTPRRARRVRRAACGG